MEKNQTKTSPTKSVGGVGAVSDVVTKRLDKLEITAGVVEKLEREVRNNAEMSSDTKPPSPDSRAIPDIPPSITF